MDMPGMERPMGPMESTKPTEMTALPGMSSANRGNPTTAIALTAATISNALPAASETAGAIHSEEKASVPPMTEMGSMTSAAGMSNAFHFGLGDPLWTTSLTPTSNQSYAGAIILLVVLAVFLRLLSTIRGMVERRWNPRSSRRCSDDEGDSCIKMGQSDGNVNHGPQWNAIIKVTKGLFQITSMATGYLLMLAVMTFNLGYLLAVLAGGFLGELALGSIEH